VMSPYERARELRAIAALTARTTFHFVWRSADAAMHVDDPSIWKVAHSQPGHEGSPALEIDVLAHEVMHRTVDELVGTEPVIFDSEEGANAFIAKEGRIMGIADPLDGTANALSLGAGYASAILLGSLSRDERYEPIGGAVATLGWTVSWMLLGPGSGEVFLGSDPLAGGLSPEEEPVPMNETDRLTWMSRIVAGDPETVAVVAAPGRRRRQLEEQFDLPGRTYTIAGNPLLPKLLRGGIGAVVELNDVALRDAIFLLPHERLGGLVTDLDGTPIDVYDTFCASSRIGPFIAANSRDSLGYVLNSRR
jgi:hypothetical protein